MSKPWKAAVAQIASVPQDSIASARKACEAIRTAGAEGARLIVARQHGRGQHVTQIGAFLKHGSKPCDLVGELVDAAVLAGDVEDSLRITPSDIGGNRS